MAKAREGRKAQREARMATRQEIAPGVWIWQDCPPGVGCCLEIPGHARKYLRDRETAIKHWRALGAA